MNVVDPTFDELREMFACLEGPARPMLSTKRSRRPRRLMVAIAIASLLIGGSVAGARSLDLFDGTPVSPAIKQKIAIEDQGAPPALDPGLETDKLVTIFSIPTEKGTVSLIAGPAKRATYCIGVTFSWGGGFGPGCDGPTTSAHPAPTPIDIGIGGEGNVGKTPIIVYGRVNDDSATQVRVESRDGSTKTLELTQGYFLAELGATAWPQDVYALDASGAVVATYHEPPLVGLPVPHDSP
jgi:hypothetical protein